VREDEVDAMYRGGFAAGCQGGTSMPRSAALTCCAHQSFVTPARRALAAERG
jgi:hypothetical protein